MFLSRQIKGKLDSFVNGWKCEVPLTKPAANLQIEFDILDDGIIEDEDEELLSEFARETLERRRVKTWRTRQLSDIR